MLSFAAPSDLWPGDTGPALQAKEGISIPTADRAAKESGSRAVAVLAGGCFWGLEGVFEHVRGVTSVSSGYAGGTKANADYSSVSSGKTGHAEAVRIVYDPGKIRYDQLLRIFFAVAHDPSQRGGQGPDHGPQYRSAIFAQNVEQRAVAKAYIAQLDKADIWSGSLTTRLENGAFYPAEAYHQDFLTKNPRHAYILRWDKPKVENLKRLYPGYYKAAASG